MCFSAALRRIPDVRHIDIDAVQYDPLTRIPEVALEASSDPRKASDLVRRFARRMGAYAVLIIHRYNDSAHKHPVTVSCWTPDGLKIVDKQIMSWSEFLVFMRTLHDMHRSYLSELEEVA